MDKKICPLSDDEVRIIKIGEDALFEFIYENFIAGQKDFLDLDPMSVTNSFYIDWETRKFVFCAYKTENDAGELLRLPKNTDFNKLISQIPDTTNSMYTKNRYHTYTKDEIEDMC